MLALMLACNVPIQVGRSDVIGTLPAEEADDIEVREDREPEADTAPPEPEDPPPPRLLLNEAMPRNRSAWQVDGALPDWIELYNADDVAVALDDVTLTDGGGRVWMGPADATLEPGARLVVFADGADADLHAPFSLDADDETLTLAVQGAVTDRLALGELGADVAWARHPDGGAWAPTLDGTPDAPNPDTPSASLDPTDAVFAPETLHTVEIALSASAEASLRADRLTYVEGAVTVDGIAYGSVGVRLKAYVGSSRTIDQKCAWRIDLNRYADNEWRGLETIVLNNMVQDYTYLHEHLAYTLYRAAGVPAPRVAYARVTMNGTDYGLYLFVEAIDDEFLSRWFTDPSGELYEGAYGVDLFSGYEWSFDQEEGVEGERTELTEVIAVLDRDATDANVAALEELVNLDGVLRNMAIEGLILHWDGYTTRNNYRLYHDPIDGRLHMIPWGTDQTFVNLYYYPWSGYGRIFTFCLANEACSARYDAMLIETAALMKSLDLRSEATELHEWLLPEINDDPRREFGWSTHEAYVDATLATIDSWPDTVIGWAEAR